ncbi:hypothetical protein BW42_02103 [Exiguobacterium sp. RIT341]|nr:hypothetical protein BW42_02103 [Exiguobacterium sp. RIT341]
MVIDYFAVLPSGKKGALEPHCLTQGTWYQLSVSMRSCSGQFITGRASSGYETRERSCGFRLSLGSVMSSSTCASLRKRSDRTDESVMSCNVNLIGLVVDYRLNSSDVDQKSRCGPMMCIGYIVNHFFGRSKKQIISSHEIKLYFSKTKTRQKFNIM